jgi:hypothetical protein
MHTAGTADFPMPAECQIFRFGSVVSVLGNNNSVNTGHCNHEILVQDLSLIREVEFVDNACHMRPSVKP